MKSKKEKKMKIGCNSQMSKNENEEGKEMDCIVWGGKKSCFNRFVVMMVFTL